jgi:hypothetical protein
MATIEREDRVSGEGEEKIREKKVYAKIKGRFISCVCQNKHERNVSSSVCLVRVVSEGILIHGSRPARRGVSRLILKLGEYRAQLEEFGVSVLTLGLR